MSEGNLARPVEGDRLADIPRGVDTAVQARLAELGLKRKPYERIATDGAYALAVVEYMKTGYDQATEAKRLEAARRKQWEGRKHYTVTQCHEDDKLSRLCQQASIDIDRFVNTAAIEFIRPLLHHPGKEQETLDELAGMFLPPAEEAKEGDPAWIVLGRGLRKALAYAIRHFQNPRAAYERPECGGYLSYNGSRLVNPWLSEITTINPALSLEYLGIEVAKGIAADAPSKVERAFNLLNHNACHGSHHEPAVLLGSQILENCALALGWYKMQERFPDPLSYRHSIRWCCGSMYDKYLRMEKDTVVAGSLAEGFRIVWDLNKSGESPAAYFTKCPFCSTAFFVPKDARCIDKKMQNDDNIPDAVKRYTWYR